MSQKYVSNRIALEMGGGADEGWSKIMKLAKGTDMINLGQGFPDFIPKGLAEAMNGGVTRALHDVPSCQYSPMRGHSRLIQAIIDLRRTLYDEKDLDPKNICVVCSGTEALYAAMQTFVNPGDEVVLFEPFFPWYLPAVRMAGGIPIVVELKKPDFRIHEVDLKRAFSSKTKLCVFNTPHNPTGAVASVEDMRLIASYCKTHDALCVSDEVYEICAFDRKKRPHVTMRDVDKEMTGRTLVLSSASKLLSVTGWRVGWIVGPEPLVNAVSATHSYVTFCAPTPLQIGVAAGIEDVLRSCTTKTQHVEDAFGLATLFGKNWLTLADALRDVGLMVCPAQGGYFLVCDCASTGLEDVAFCKWLIENAKIVGVPLSLFYSDPNKTRHLIRFAICKTEKAMKRAADALRAVKSIIPRI